MVRLEMHFINPTAGDRSISATTTVIPIADEDYRDEADFLFIGNPDIRIQPHSTAELGPTFFRLPHDLSGVKFFAMTGHEHQFGTNVRVATATNAADTGQMVYDVPGWIWSEPETMVFSPAFTVPDGGGFRFTCSWNNTSDKVVGFGESASDEMCFFWAYYYPSRGAKVCFHTEQGPGGKGDPVDVCCPGSIFCPLITEYLGRD